LPTYTGERPVTGKKRECLKGVVLGSCSFSNISNHCTSRNTLLGAFPPGRNSGDQGGVPTHLIYLQSSFGSSNAEFIVMQSPLVKGSDLTLFLDFIPPHNGAGLERSN
jgi:hypothetical protein